MWKRVGKKDGKGEWKRGCVEEVEERGKGDGQKGQEKRGKGASASAFLAFFCLYLRGGTGLNQEPFFFFRINSFLYTCFSGRAVLVVFGNPKTGAFDRVTGRQRDGTGRGGRKYILGSRLA